MSQEMPPEGNQPIREGGPTHSPRMWRNCCLSPALALSLILVAVGLSRLNTYIKNEPVRRQTSAEETKLAFMKFGDSFFTIARRADAKSTVAFGFLRAMTEGKGNIKDMQHAFHDAADASDKAAKEFNGLDVPKSLASRRTLLRSVAVMSQAYRARGQACRVLAKWNGDLDDKYTVQLYIQQADLVQKLTEASLRDFVSAAVDNGLTQDDLRRIVYKGALTTLPMQLVGAFPAKFTVDETAALVQKH